MVASLPRLRGDLAVSQQVTADGVIFVVKDPVRDCFFRLPEEAHFIAEQLDGKTELEVVRHRTEERFQTSLPPEQLDAFVSSLTTAGLLDTGEKVSSRSRTRRLQGSLLYLRFRLFDPDRLFNYLVSKIRFFFTPAFLLVSAIVILSAVGVASANWGDALQNISRLLQVSAIPLIVVVIFLVVTLHEFAHGLTCKRFGGEVHELGFFLIYFQPALYCNVSDAWLFPEKAKRLWVGFAGPYFELFLWGLATLAWRLTDVETTINYLALIVMTTSGIKTLFNFNPLIKLDGYYLLSDWLEIPNLRKKSFACLSNSIKTLFGAKIPELKRLSIRERRIFITYGLVALVGSFSLLGYATLTIGDALLAQGQPLLFALPVFLLGVRFRSRIRRLLGKSNVSDDLDDDPTDAPVDPKVRKDLPTSETSPQQEPPASKSASATETRKKPSESTPEPPKSSKPKKRKRLPRWVKRALTLTMLGGAISAVLHFVHTDLRVKGPFDVLPVRNADVRTGAEGIIEEVCVSEGETIQQGDVVARLFDRDVRAELQKTGAAIEEGQAKLRLLLAGPRPEEIEHARIQVTKSTEEIKFATSRLERDRDLNEGKLLSKQELEDSQANLARVQSELAAAQSKLNLLLAGSRPEEIEAMKAAITSLTSQQRYLEEQLRLMQILSPASGVVATPSRQLLEMKHQLVKKGDLVAKVFELKTVIAEMVISEKDIADVKVGQKVVLKVRAYPEMTFYGTVRSIATAAQSTSSSGSSSLLSGGSSTSPRNSASPKTVTITTEIDNSTYLLKPEMTGQAKIYCGERRLLDLALRRIARTVKVEFWSWW